MHDPTVLFLNARLRHAKMTLNSREVRQELEKKKRKAGQVFPTSVLFPLLKRPQLASEDKLIGNS